MALKRILAALTLCALIFSLASCSKTEKGKEDEGENEVKYGRYIYVSEDGNDSNSGEEASPVRTFAGAVEILRKIKAEGLPEGGVCVTFAKGNYPVTSTVTFTEADSGEADKPIVFKGEEGAVLNGGVDIPVESFSPVSEAAKAKLPTEDAKANVLEADIGALGVTDYSVTNGYAIEFFCDTARQTIARYPNDGGYIKSNHVESGDNFIRQSAPEDKVAMWANSTTINYYGYPEYDWRAYRAFSDTITVDVENSSIVLSGTTAVKVDQPYYVYNLIEELDVPGEFYIDPDGKKLYYYPDGSIEGKHFAVTSFPGNFITLAGASYLTLEGLTFENARGTVVDSDWSAEAAISHHITFKNCLVRDVTLNALYLRGSDIKVYGCEMYEIGSTAIMINTPNTNSLIPSNSSVENCYIHGFSRVNTVYTPAVNFYGYGLYCGHNEFCDSTHEAIAFNCSGSIIEYNYIHDVCSETSDAGAVYSGRRFDWRGNIIRYNLIENIIDIVHGGGPNGIYCDDSLAEVVCYGNILKNIAGNAFAMGGGRDSKVYNNLIINCKGRPINYDERGIGWASYHVRYSDGYMWQCLLNTDYMSDLQRYAFPKNLIMIESSYSNSTIPDLPGVPANNYICRNVSVNSEYEDVIKDAEGKDKYATSVGVELLVNAASTVDKYGMIVDNMAYDSNPGIKDIEGGDYTILEDSPIFRDIIGFEQIPFEKIGRE